VVRHVFALRLQGAKLEKKKSEADMSSSEVAAIQKFAAYERQRVRDDAAEAKQDYDAEIAKMRTVMNDFDEFVRSIEDRISGADRRRVIIRDVIDQFFVKM
jgi:hypothetical protein